MRRCLRMNEVNIDIYVTLDKRVVIFVCAVRTCNELGFIFDRLF